jgi:uncharacterized membrane protein YidH (DUF202 family)
VSGRAGPDEPPADLARYERDGGLAAERTELAWGRSTLAVFVCALAVARGLPELTGVAPQPVAGLVVLGAGAVAWLAGLPYERARARAGHQGVRHVATPRELAPVAFGTVLVGVAALSAALLSTGT